LKSARGQRDRAPRPSPNVGYRQPPRGEAPTRPTAPSLKRSCEQNPARSGCGRSLVGTEFTVSDPTRSFSQPPESARKTSMVESSHPLVLQKRPSFCALTLNTAGLCVYGQFSNVSPDVAHPRCSQSSERPSGGKCMPQLECCNVGPIAGDCLLEALGLRLEHLPGKARYDSGYDSAEEVECSTS
jgi:hypothetical protein